MSLPITFLDTSGDEAFTPMRARGAQATDIAIQAKEILFLKKQLNQMLAKHTGRPVEEIERITDRDYYLSPREAAEIGLIDKVVEKNTGT